jgi:DUF438 domain-containing protein
MGLKLPKKRAIFFIWQKYKKERTFSYFCRQLSKLIKFQNMDKYFKELPFMAITISDKDGKFIEMNDRSILTFANSGGENLIGKDMMTCHPPKAQEIIKKLIENNETNCYTIEKQGLKKLIYQTPWYENGQYSGLIEFSIVIPNEMLHFIRN